MGEMIVHIGLHKTATTALQNQLFPSCEGVNLLTTERDEVRRFVHMLTRKDELYFDSREALKAIAPAMGSGVNLLSNESLSGPPYAGVMEGGLDHRASIIGNLSSTFPEARIIIVIRRQNDLCRSLYRQYLKIGGTRNPTRFYGITAGDRDPLMSLDRFYFKRYVDALVKAFPRGVLILTFEEFISNREAFLEKLSDFVGVKVHNIPLTKENSTKLGAFGLEVTRLANHLFRSYGNPGGMLPGVPVRNTKGVLELRSPISLVHDHWPGKGGVEAGTLFSIGEDILKRVEKDNRELDQAYSLGLRRYGYY